MADVANAVMAVHGDEFDFIGVWLNFDPHHTIGSAVYFSIENDVSGIGINPDVGTEIFNSRPELGIGGENIEGMVIMWNVNGNWQTGTGSNAEFTRIALAHEYEHRFGINLPPLLDGTPMQGSGPSCYAAGHWNFQLDAQGSCMGLSEWVGSDPAIPANIGVQFNSDTGGLYSYTDLYLMGYASPAEMDAGNSEFRSMVGSNCTDSHFGPIRDITSADIVDAAGPRVPDSGNRGPGLPHRLGHDPPAGRSARSGGAGQGARHHPAALGRFPGQHAGLRHDESHAVRRLQLQRPAGPG